MKTPPSEVPAGQEPRLLSTSGGLFAVDKPEGMAVHPTGDGRPDLLGWLASRYPGVQPIHRLDLATSGVVLCAADPAVRAQVSGWLARGELDKRYLALVHGHTHRKGTIRKALYDSRRRRPLPATTRYLAVEGFVGTTLLRIRPETGRKHQIRRHLQGIGHPVVGDLRYPPRRFLPVPGFPGRLWLHALEVILPDGARIEAPLPDALQVHLEHLREARERARGPEGARSAVRAGGEDQAAAGADPAGSRRDAVYGGAPGAEEAAEGPGGAPGGDRPGSAGGRPNGPD